MFFAPPVGWKTGIPAIAITDDGDAAPSGGAGGSAHTFGSKSSAGPHCVVLLTYKDATANQTVSSITWGGSAVSILAQTVAGSGGGRLGSAIGIIAGAQSGDIVVTFSGAVQESCITYASLTNVQSITAVDADNATGTGASVSINLDSAGNGGIRLYTFAHVNDSVAVDFSAGTELSDIDSGGSHRHAANYILGSGTGSVSGAWTSSSGRQVMSAVALR